MIIEETTEQSTSTGVEGIEEVKIHSQKPIQSISIGLVIREIFYNEVGEAVAQVTQRSCGWPIPRNVQGQIGYGSEHPDCVEGERVFVHGRGLD